MCGVGWKVRKAEHELEDVDREEVREGVDRRLAYWFGSLGRKLMPWV